MGAAWGFQPEKTEARCNDYGGDSRECHDKPVVNIPELLELDPPVMNPTNGPSSRSELRSPERNTNFLRFVVKVDGPHKCDPRVSYNIGCVIFGMSTSAHNY
ncbi:hypothetical protein OSB04_010349 [Centaurea solstitialis]|uniref:Uncharacterized protein n=1 Tax=Centaurea solstitialis TaxID=347529 RepID=A0AA38T7D6_9ASTR|nr:hypothetical protein OSB04_010349 [Centaurea solstitialis]